VGEASLFLGNEVSRCGNSFSRSGNEVRDFGGNYAAGRKVRERGEVFESALNRRPVADLTTGKCFVLAPLVFL
jgi:hypothetical protein